MTSPDPGLSGAELMTVIGVVLGIQIILGWLLNFHARNAGPKDFWINRFLLPYVGWIPMLIYCLYLLFSRKVEEPGYAEPMDEPPVRVFS